MHVAMLKKFGITQHASVYQVTERIDVFIDGRRILRLNSGPIIGRDALGGEILDKLSFKDLELVPAESFKSGHITSACASEGSLE